MQLRPLGRTGLRVPPICLGTMTFGLQCDEATSFAILDRAFEGGVDFIDTADVYPLGGDLTTVGRTEEIVGRWMRDRGNRDRIVLATKCAGRVGPGPNDGGLSRYHIQRAVEASLRRLGTDVIDLYQVHAFDPHVPIDETLRALDDLVRAGKVRYAGCSNYPAWRLGQALAASSRLGINRYETVQPRYNLLYRDIETELLPLCQSEALGVVVYNPLAGGFLSGKYAKGTEPQDGTRFTLGNAGRMYQKRYWNDAQFDAVSTLRGAVEDREKSLASVAVAWVLEQPGITSAIVGASKPAQLDDTLVAADLQLDDELRQACDAAWWQLPHRRVVEGYR
ncbi:MAG: aldo/keto reductase [Dehalococcoidia bacterium]|nr:MAG: aldo/keto reductase [Dehalococcoidia bacterium]